MRTPPLLILAVLCLYLGNCLKFVVTVSHDIGPVCFYEYLTSGQKYAFQTLSRGHSQFVTQIERTNDAGVYEAVVIKEAKNTVENINKIADRAGTYRFCVINRADDILRMGISIMTGLELVNLNYLPSNDDQENLHREIDWLQGQKKTLFDALNRIQGVRVTSSQLNAKMNTNYIVLAVVGLLAIVGVNFLFYTQTKKTLKDRKLI